MFEKERRAFPVEVRKEGDEPRKIVGYAAKFDTESQLLGWFREVIRPGAFEKALESSDVRALWNHNDDYVLGRTKSGTLSLRQDDVGLWIEIEPPDTQWARDLMLSIERGDVDQMSFAFSDVTDRTTDDGDVVLRELLEIRALYDVSPVTYPAYEDTEVFLRSGHRPSEEEEKRLRAYLKPDPDPAPAGQGESGTTPEEHDPAPAGRHAPYRQRDIEIESLASDDHEQLTTEAQ